MPVLLPLPPEQPPPRPLLVPQPELPQVLQPLVPQPVVLQVLAVPREELAEPVAVQPEATPVVAKPVVVRREWTEPKVAKAKVKAKTNLNH